MKIYIETTIPSYLVARPARDLLQAARQQLTHDWWRLQRERHELFTSQVCLDEVAQGNAEMAVRRLQLLAPLAKLPATQPVESLTLQFMRGVLPPAADRDAAHIALATVHEMDILLSWNCRHIANAAIQNRLRHIAEAAGFTLPVLCTPEELMGENYEIND